MPTYYLVCGIRFKRLLNLGQAAYLSRSMLRQNYL